MSGDENKYETSGYEISGDEMNVQGWNVLQPFECSFHSATVLHSNSQSRAGHFDWKAYTALDIVFLSSLQSKSKMLNLWKIFTTTKLLKIIYIM